MTTSALVCVPLIAGGGRTWITKSRILILYSDILLGSIAVTSLLVMLL